MTVSTVHCPFQVWSFRVFLTWIIGWIPIKYVTWMITTLSNSIYSLWQFSTMSENTGASVSTNVWLRTGFPFFRDSENPEIILISVIPEPNIEVKWPIYSPSVVLQLEEVGTVLKSLPQLHPSVMGMGYIMDTISMIDQNIYIYTHDLQYIDYICPIFWLYPIHIYISLIIIVYSIQVYCFTLLCRITL